MKPNVGVGLQPYCLSPCCPLVRPLLWEQHKACAGGGSPHSGPLWAAQRGRVPTTRSRGLHQSFCSSHSHCKVGTLAAKGTEWFCRHQADLWGSSSLQSPCFHHGTSKSLLSLLGNVLALLVLCPGAQGWQLGCDHKVDSAWSLTLGTAWEVKSMALEKR